jgi:hypothetical protein
LTDLTLFLYEIILLLLVLKSHIRDKGPPHSVAYYNTQWGVEGPILTQNGLKKICRKKLFKKYHRNNNYEECTALARCFPSILDAIILENINLSEEKIGRPALWSNFVISRLYTVSAVYISR